MSPRPTSRAATALVAGTTTALYYATPDVISSRTARGWAKAGLVVVSVAAAVPDARAAWAAGRAPAPDDGAEAPATFGALPTRTKAITLGVAAVALGGAIVGMRAIERRVFRLGQARAAAGKRRPHTAPALVYGALAGALTLLPPTDPLRGR